MNVYVTRFFRARIGWCGDVTLSNGDMAPLAAQGPMFWRPTRRGVERRVMRHVRRRLQVEERRAAAETMTLP